MPYKFVHTHKTHAHAHVHIHMHTHAHASMYTDTLAIEEMPLIMLFFYVAPSRKLKFGNGAGEDSLFVSKTLQEKQRK